MKIKKIKTNLLLALISILLTSMPVKAADNVFLTYRSLKFSLRVESLEEFAKTGNVNQDLRFFLQFLGEREREEFRTILNKQLEIDPVLLSRLLNTDIGEDLLKRLGTILNIPWSINGKFAIRGALVKSAFTPEGLTLLGFLQQFPTNLHIDVHRSLQIVTEIEKAIATSSEMVTKIDGFVTEEVSKSDAPNFSKLPDLTQRGNQGIETETIVVTDQKRKRTFNLLIYKPKIWLEGKTPVIVVSHGLASRGEDFKNAAEQLASHGYLVALPQHIGSDIIQAENLIKGFSRQVFYLNEFIDRPLDMSFVIDYLETKNASVYQNRLNLKEVGVGGHSFGGYTALALGGATIDFDYLESECEVGKARLNISLLLQCRALKLPRQEYNFKDERVKAIFVVNPVNSSIFGPKGLAKITVPVMMIGGSYDPATPPIYEQFRSFPWLNNSQVKFLGLVEGQAHVNFSKLDPGIQQTIESLDFLTLPDSELLIKYGNALVTSFFGAYLKEDKTYVPFVENFPAYSQYLSQNEQFRLFLVTSKSSPLIRNILLDFGIK